MGGEAHVGGSLRTLLEFEAGVNCLYAWDGPQPAHRGSSASSFDLPEVAAQGARYRNGLCKHSKR